MPRSEGGFDGLARADPAKPPVRFQSQTRSQHRASSRFRAGAGGAAHRGVAVRSLVCAIRAVSRHGAWKFGIVVMIDDNFSASVMESSPLPRRRLLSCLTAQDRKRCRRGLCGSCLCQLPGNCGSALCRAPCAAARKRERRVWKGQWVKSAAVTAMASPAGAVVKEGPLTKRGQRFKVRYRRRVGLPNVVCCMVPPCGL